MLYRYAQNKGYDVTASADLSGYPDAGQIQSWAQEAMTWAVAEGIVEGMDGNLNPAGHATRAQIATILMRFCEGVAKSVSSPQRRKESASWRSPFLPR